MTPITAEGNMAPYDDDLEEAQALGLPDQAALKQKLYANLMSRLDGGDPLAADRKAAADQDRRNALLASLQQSSNQLGAVGGKAVQNDSLSKMAGAISQSNQADLGAQGEGLAQKDKVQDYLLGQIQKSDTLGAQLKQRADERRMMLAQQKQIADDNRAASGQRASEHNDLMRTLASQKIDAQQQGQQSKLGHKDDAAFQKLAHDINPGLAGARSDFGKQQGLVSAADRLLTLGKQVEGQEGGGDKRQIHELAIASANLVSGGGSGAAQATIEALVPHSLSGSAAGIEEWLTSNPTGTNQQQFVRRMLETADREKAMASDKVKTIQSGILSSYGHLKDKNPDRYNSIQKMYFGDNAQFDPSGKYVSAPPDAPKGPSEAGTAMAAPVQKMDPKISEYAGSHGLDYMKARSILAGRGYQPNE